MALQAAESGHAGSERHERLTERALAQPRTPTAPRASSWPPRPRAAHAAHAIIGFSEFSCRRSRSSPSRGKSGSCTTSTLPATISWHHQQHPRPFEDRSGRMEIHPESFFLRQEVAGSAPS